MENFLEDYSKLLDDSKEHLSNATIATYLNLKEQLSDKEKRFIESHIEKCSKCREALDLIQNEDLEIDLGKSTPPKIFRIASYWKYASAAVIVISVITILYFSLSPTSENLITEELIPIDSTKGIKTDTSGSSSQTQKPIPMDVVKKDESVLEKGNELFAANDVLENFINRNVRSESKIVIVSPEPGDTVSTTITFKWKQISQVKELILIVVNNKNKPVYQALVAGNKLSIDKKLNAGLYYWKLEAEGKLEVIGKFVVLN